MADTEKKEQEKEPITGNGATPESEQADVAAAPTNTAEPTTSESAPTEETATEPEEQGAPIEDEKAIEMQKLAAEQQAQEEALAAEAVEKQEVRPGMTVRVHQKIKEGDKERIQIFQGIVIALRGKTPETKTMTVQKRSFGIIVEKIFPVNSPLIEKVEVVKKAKVRHSKLYYIATYPKRLKEKLVKQ